MYQHDLGSMASLPPWQIPLAPDPGSKGGGASLLWLGSVRRGNRGRKAWKPGWDTSRGFFSATPELWQGSQMFRMVRVITLRFGLPHPTQLPNLGSSFHIDMFHHNNTIVTQTYREINSSFIIYACSYCYLYGERCKCRSTKPLFLYRHQLCRPIKFTYMYIYARTHIHTYINLCNWRLVLTHNYNSNAIIIMLAVFLLSNSHEAPHGQ